MVLRKPTQGGEKRAYVARPWPLQPILINLENLELRKAVHLHRHLFTGPRLASRKIEDIPLAQRSCKLAHMVGCAQLFRYTLASFVAAGAAGCSSSNSGATLSTGGVLACRTGTGPFNVQYTLKSGLASDPCGALTFDTLLVNSYDDVKADGAPPAVSSAITTEALSNREELTRMAGAQGDGRPLSAVGSFAAGTPQNDICNIPTLTQTVKDFPALPAVPADPEGASCGEQHGRSALPATHIVYEWSNWRIYYTDAHRGNQFEVHLKYTVDGATCEYEGHAALFGNQQSCLTADPSPPDCKTQPSDIHPEVCDAAPHPELSPGAAGSGIDPAYPVACDAISYLCYVPGDFPALK